MVDYKVPARYSPRETNILEVISDGQFKGAGCCVHLGNQGILHTEPSNTRVQGLPPQLQLKPRNLTSGKTRRSMNRMVDSKRRNFKKQCNNTQLEIICSNREPLPGDMSLLMNLCRSAPSNSLSSSDSADVNSGSDWLHPSEMVQDRQ